MHIISDFAASDIGHVIITLAIALIVVLVGNKISLTVINKISKRIEPNALHWKLVKQAVKILWIVVFVLAAVENVPGLSSIGTALVAFSSVVVAAFGLASQDALGNALDGVLISLFKPFAVGDRVRLVSRDVVGTVVDINLRYTSIKTVENNVLMIPNSIMNDEILENANIFDTNVKSFLDIEISYDSDIQLAKKIIAEKAAAHPLFVDLRTDEDKANGVPPVTVLTRSFTANGIELRATLCTADTAKSFTIASDLREQIFAAFTENNISIPYQTIDLIMHDKSAKNDINQSISTTTP